MSSSVSLSIGGVYLPTANNSLNLYKEWVQELEILIYALQTDGPVLVMGDIDLMNCTGHFAISLSDLAKGPMHVYLFQWKKTAQQWTTASLTVGPPTW